MIRPISLLTIFLAGCATVRGGADQPSGDTRHWITYRVEIGDQVLQFSIPPGVNEDFMDPREVPKRIDVQNPIANDTSSVGVLLRRWDYRRSPFSPILGTLTASIGLIYSEKPLSDMVSVQEAVKQHNEHMQNLEIARDPKYTGPATPPVRFDSVKISGRDAWYVSFRILPPSYVMPLDNHHYLGIGIDNGVYSGAWRENAQAAADAILKSIKIESKP